MPKPQIRSNPKVYSIIPIEKRGLSGYVLLLFCIVVAYLGIIQHRYWHQQIEMLTQQTMLETQNSMTDAIEKHLHTSDSVAVQELLFSWKNADVMLVEVDGVKSLRVFPHP